MNHAIQHEEEYNTNNPFTQQAFLMTLHHSGPFPRPFPLTTSCSLTLPTSPFSVFFFPRQCLGFRLCRSGSSSSADERFFGLGYSIRGGFLHATSGCGECQGLGFACARWGDRYRCRLLKRCFIGEFGS